MELVNQYVISLQSLVKSLSKYLESKRQEFPRFYFLSNEQIIELVGQVSDLDKLESNFFKMFEGVSKLVIQYQVPQD